MQLHAGEALDLARETPETLELYGIGQPRTDSYGRRCLMARRLVERGVRFVQIFVEGQIWDTHTKNAAGTTDVLRADRQADRRPAQGPEAPRACSTRRWSSGAASSAGPRSARAATAATTTSRASASGWPAAASAAARPTAPPTSWATTPSRTATMVADLHATILHLLGLDHRKVTYHLHGRDERLTDVYDAKVITPLLA